MIPRPLTTLAWVNIALHAVGLVAAVAGMRPGTAVAQLAERMSYLAAAPLGWCLGWVVWAGCAVALVAFLAVVIHRLGVTPLARIGLTVAVVALGFDLTADTVYVFVYPPTAAGGPADERLFLTLDRVTTAVSLVTANGGYSVAVLFVTLALRVDPRASRPAVWLGYAVFAAGMLLAISGFTGDPRHIEWATGPTIGLFAVWVLAVARGFERGAKP